MARLLFGGDDVDIRGPYGAAVLSASGRTGIVYADATTSALADIVTYPGGAAIAGSVITVTADSQLPLFQGPADGSDTVWVSVDGGTRTPIYTNVDARLDLLATSVGTKASVTYVDAQDAAAISTAETFATGAVGTEATARAAADGTRLNWRGAWAATTAYVTNDLVTFNGGLYRAPSSFTSGGSFVLANWVELVAQSGTYALLAGSTYSGTQDFTGATVLGVGGGNSVTENTQTAAYTLVLADAGKVIGLNSASAAAVTVPPNSSVAFPVGTVIGVDQIGAGQVTVAAGGGVTIMSANSRLALAGQYSGCSLRKRATDSWLLQGDLV